MANITLPGVGVVILPATNSLNSPSLPVSICTAPGNLGCVYWGDHLTINDSSTCPIRVRNNSQTPLTLKMTGTINGLNCTGTPPPGSRAWGISWDKENTILNAGDYLNATLHLHIPHAMITADYPFVTQVTITGTP